MSVLPLLYQHSHQGINVGGSIIMYLISVNKNKINQTSFNNVFFTAMVGVGGIAAGLIMVVVLLTIIVCIVCM